METFLAARSFLLISVSKNLLDNENKITASFITNYQQNQFELSNNEKSLYKFRYNEENNENLVFIFELNANYKLKLAFNSKEKEFNINVNDFKSNDFWEMKIENEDFFDENSKRSFKACEDTGLTEGAKKCLSNPEQMRQTIQTSQVAGSELQKRVLALQSQLAQAAQRQDLAEIDRINAEIIKISNENNSISNSQSGQKTGIPMLNSSGYQVMPPKIADTNNFYVEEPKKCNRKLLGFGIATVVAFLVTLFFGIATFGFGLFSMLLGGILFGVSAGATIGFGVPFTIFIKNERENKKTSKLGQESLIPGDDDSNIPGNAPRSKSKIPKRTTGWKRQEQTFN